MYYMLIGAAALSMVCGPVVLRWFRSRRLKRQLNLFQYECVRPISTTTSAAASAAAAMKPTLNAAHVDDCASGPDYASQVRASQFFGWLGSLAPRFGVNGNKIKLLSEPREFYDTLTNLGSKAKKRIVLTSLYLGTDSLERELVDVIHRRVHNENRLADGDLTVRVLLDYSRGSRGKKSSSRTILLPLVTDFPDHVKVSLFHSPDLRGLTKLVLPERVNEVVGLQHMKLYIFDNSLVISGANLSCSYFDNRQDRYILIENCDEIVDFFADLVDIVSSFSFQLQPSGSTLFPSSFPYHPFHGYDGGERFRGAANSAVEDLLHSRVHSELPLFPTATAESPPHTSSDIVASTSSTTSTTTAFATESNSSTYKATHNSFHSSHCPVKIEKSPLLTAWRKHQQQLPCQNSKTASNNTTNTQLWLHNHDPATAPTENSSDSSKEATKEGISTNDHDEIDTWIYPLVQMAPLGVHVDSMATEALLESAPSKSQVFLASGYFNLTQNYMDVILEKSKADFQILMASPKVNGFYGAHGISGNIPAVYTNIAKEFYFQLVDRDQNSRIALHEYYRDDWTFHAKGLWYYRPGECLPCMTLIGSPNFGFRSVSRDLEAQLAVVTENETLRQQLDDERKRLYSRTSTVSEQTFMDDDHIVPNWVGMVTGWIKNYF